LVGWLDDVVKFGIMLKGGKHDSFGQQNAEIVELKINQTNYLANEIFWSSKDESSWNCGEDMYKCVGFGIHINTDEMEDRQMTFSCGKKKRREKCN